MIRRAVLLILILALLATAVGCAMAAPALTSTGVGGADEMSRGLAPEMAPPAEAPAAMAEGQALALPTQDFGGERMIVRTGNLAIMVENTEETLSAIERLASELGGYVSDLQSWRQDDQMAATVTIRILAESFDQARERVKELAIEVESENASGQDVTEEYVDLEARLSNLEVAEQELRELLASAQETHKDAESILAIYNEITNVRMQIEQIKGRMKYLESASELATLTITVTPEKPVVEPGWEPLRQARDALRTLVNALKGLSTVMIWVVLFFLPLAAILLLPLILVWLVWYLRRRRRRRAKAE